MAFGVGGRVETRNPQRASIAHGVKATQGGSKRPVQRWNVKRKIGCSRRRSCRGDCNAPMGIALALFGSSRRVSSRSLVGSRRGVENMARGWRQFRTRYCWQNTLLAGQTVPRPNGRSSVRRRACVESGTAVAGRDRRKQARAGARWAGLDRGSWRVAARRRERWPV